MVLAPLFLAAGAVATSVLNAKGRFGGRRARTARLQPRDHRRGAAARARVRRRRPRARRRASAPRATCSSSCPSVARIGARIRPRVDLGDAQAAQGARADGPARARPRGDPGRVPGDDQPRVDARRRARSPVFTFAFAVLQIPIGVIGVPLGIVLLPSLSREAATGATRGVRAACSSGPRDARARDGRRSRRIGIVVSEDVVRLLFGIAGDQRARASRRPRAALAVVPPRADRPLADRGPRAGVLRAPGHADAGRSRRSSRSRRTS